MNEPVMFEGAPVFMVVMGALIIFLVLVANLISILILCKIFAKAGYHWATGLLALVPIVGLFLPVYLAFGDWPVQQELRELRQRLGIVPGQNAHVP